MSDGKDLRTTVWTYAWDVLDVGLDAALADITGRAGAGGVSLAASYHAGHFFQPRSPRRKAYWPEDGTVYFEPTPGRFDGLRLQPKVASVVRERGDVLRTLIDARERGAGITVNAWTVCLHNMRLGLAHPEVCSENAWGDRSYFALSPAHPDARAYVVAMIADMADRYALDSIELETPNFMEFLHGYHHEKDGVGLNPEDDFLLSLDFSEACLERARAAGVDGEAAKRTARRLIGELCERAMPAARWPDFTARGPEVFRDEFPELYEYVTWRFEPVTSLVREIRAAVNPRTKVYFIDIDGGWRVGCDLEAIARECDGIVHCRYDRKADALGPMVRDTMRLLPGRHHFSTGLQVFTPNLSGPDDLTARVRAAVAAGSTGINFYNYGLIPAARLDWIRGAIEAARG
ncbi:MAG TPA: hypothetical protein VFG47_01385 [Geminicoccaceae bacterium]|nr:hypothetical protein [Geminicoccaceae bacterium]